MAADGVKEVGNVGIRAKPLTNGFRAKLQEELRKIENSLLLEIDTEINEKELKAEAKADAKKASGEKVKFEADLEDKVMLKQLRNIQRKLDKLSKSNDRLIELKVDEKSFNNDLKAVKKELSGLKAEIKPILKKVDTKSFETIALRMRVELDPASVREVEAAVEEMKAELKRTPVELDIQIERNGLRRMETQLDQVVRGNDWSRKVDVHFEPETTALDALLANLAAQDDQEVPVALSVDSSTVEETRARIDAFMQELNALAEVEVAAGTDRTSLAATIAEVQTALSFVHANIGANINQADVLTAVAALQALINELNADVELGVDLDAGDAIASVKELQAELAAATAVDPVEIDAEVEDTKTKLDFAKLMTELKTLATKAELKVQTQIEASRSYNEFRLAVIKLRQFARGEPVEINLGTGDKAVTLKFQSVLAGLRKAAKAVGIDIPVDVNTKVATTKLHAWLGAVTKPLRANIRVAFDKLPEALAVLRGKVAAAAKTVTAPIRTFFTGLATQTAKLRTWATGAAKAALLRIPVVTEHKAALAKLLGVVKTFRLRIPLHVTAGAALAGTALAVKAISKVAGKVVVPLVVHTAKATATALSWATRMSAAFLINPLTKWIVVKVSEASLAKAMLALKALSGFNMFDRFASDMGKMVTNFDKLAVSAGVTGLAFASFANIGIGALGSLVTIGGDLVAILGALWAAPAFLAATAVQAVVLGSAFKDLKDRLGDLQPAFSGLQDTISQNFWASAEQPIRNLINNQLPALEAGFTSVADAMGQSWGSFAAQLDESLTGRIGPMFDNLTESINNSRAGTDAWADSIAILGTVGSKYLPKFGTWFSDISTQFNDFLTEAEADGRLEEWIDNGIEQLKNLGKVMVEVSRIGGLMYRMFESAGFAGLGDLADGLENVRKTMQSPAFQLGAQSILEGAHEGISQMVDGIGEAFSALGGLSTEIGEVLSDAGTAAGSLFGLLADIFSADKFGTGLVDLFDGIVKAAEGLRPMGEDLGELFGLFGSSAGQFIGVLGQELGNFADAGLILNSVMAELGPIAASLTSGLAGAIRAVLPPFVTFVDTILPTLSTLLQTVGPLFEGIGQVVGGLLAPALGLLAAVLEPVMSLLNGAVERLTPLFSELGTQFQGLSGMFEGNAGAFAEGIVQMVEGLGAALPAFVQVGTDLILGLVNGIVAAIPGVAAAIGEIFPVLWNELLAAIPLLLDSGTQIVTALLQGITESIPSLATMFTDVMVGIVEAIATNLPMIVQSGLAFINALLEGIIAALPVLMEGAVTIIQGLTQGITDNLPLIIEAAVALITGLITAITENLPLLIEAALALVNGLLAGIIEALPLLIEGALTLLNALVTALVENLPLIIETGISLLVSLIEGIVEALPMLIDAALQLVIGLAQAIIDNLPLIIEAGIQGLISLVNGLVSALPRLLAAAVTLITALAGALIKNLPTLLVKAVEIMVQLALSLVKAIPQLLAAVPKIFKSLADEFMSMNWGEVLVDAGKNLIEGLIEGIKGMASAAWDAVMGIGNSLVDGFKDMFGIQSPSKVMKQLGIYIGQGTVLGIEHEKDNATDAMKKLVEVPTAPVIPIKADLSMITGTAGDGSVRPGFVQNNDITMPRSDPAFVFGELGAAVSRQRAMAGI